MNQTNWQDKAPDHAGVWVMRCGEDETPALVRVFRRLDGVLMADDPHLGVLGLSDLHDGLTRAEWSLVGEG